MFQIVELTGCSQDMAEIALYDSKNDMNNAVAQILEGKADEVSYDFSTHLTIANL